MGCSGLSSFQMCLLSSVLYSFSLLVKDALWDVYRILKLLAVSPMYFLLLLGVVTVCMFYNQLHLC